MNLYPIEAGPLPLANRFIRITLKDTVRLIPASVALDLATEYYEQAGWCEDCELAEDRKLKQLRGKELRECIEVNGDLPQAVRDAHWSSLQNSAKLIAGPGLRPPRDDECWWFEENGGLIDEVTDLPPSEQKPQYLLWCSAEWAKEHGVIEPQINPGLVPLLSRGPLGVE